MSGGLTAAGLVVLLLGLIGSGVGLYYAYICLQARPLRPKKHKDAEHGPLIPPDPDVNGNHEDVPIEASAPLDEDANANDKLHIDEPDHAPISPDLQEENSTKSPKDKEDVLISVEDDVPPAKVTHEKETAPVVSHPAPLGFVVPTSTASPQEAPLDHHPQTGNLQLQPQPQPHSQPQPQPHSQPQPQLQPQPQPQPQSQPLPQPQSQPEPSKIEVPPCSKAPVPVYIPPPQQKKPIAISDEEDGLLLQEPAPQDNSLNPELCATLPISHSPWQTGLKEEPETTPQNNPPASPPKPEAQPVVVVVPNMAPSCPEKEEVKPVGKAPDPLLSENCDKPAPLYMKEDDEHLQSAATSKDINKATPIPTTEPVPAAESIPQETVSEEPKDSINKETCVDSDDSLSTDGPHDWIDAAPEFVEGTEAAKSSSEDDKTKISSEDAEVLEEPRPDSHCSVSSEEPDPPHHDPAIAEVGTLPLASPESHPKPREGSEEAVTNDTPASPPVAPEPPCDSPTPDTTEEHMSHATKEDLAPNVIVHSSADEDDALSEASSDTSDAVCDDTDIPTEAPLTPSDSDTHPGKEASATPLQPPVVVPMDTPCVPMEAYSAVPDDLSDEEGSALPVIKEEGSAENNSEGTDTESSEPEVTEYSFSSGPSAPSTTGVLANEVSCTLEPKVTKFIPIDDLDASESEGSEISDEDMEKDLTSPSDSDEEIHSPSIPLENKAMAAETSPGATEKNNTVSDHPDLSKQNISPKEKLDMSSNGPAPSESPALTPDAADKLPEEESDSGDSETESEGTEAEVEVKEEVVSIPAVVCNNTNSHIAESPVPPSANHTGSSSVACPPTAQLLKAAQGNGNSLEEIPKVTDEGDGLSVSTTESCDLSDGEVTTSTPKKSMIPRLVKQNEA